jgi:hypothetical protein
MPRIFKQCVSKIDRQAMVIGLIAAAGLALCFQLSAIGLLSGAVPLLLILACLAPCLVPLASLRRGSRSDMSCPPAPNNSRSKDAGRA